MANPNQSEKKEVVKPLSSALKRQKQSEKRKLRNKNVRSQIRTAIKNFRSSFAQNEEQALHDALKSISSLLDKAAAKGVFKLNKASRLKSRLTCQLRAKAATK